MHIAFVSSACETLAIEYLTAALQQAGHRCSLCFDPQLFDDTFLHNRRLKKLFDFSEEIVEELSTVNPDLRKPTHGMPRGLYWHTGCTFRPDAQRSVCVIRKATGGPMARGVDSQQQVFMLHR